MSSYGNILFGIKLNGRLIMVAMDERVQWRLNDAALEEEAKDRLSALALDPISTAKASN